LIAQLLQRVYLVLIPMSVLQSLQCLLSCIVFYTTIFIIFKFQSFSSKKLGC
jgi:hypothetical protein